MSDTLCFTVGTPRVPNEGLQNHVQHAVFCKGVELVFGGWPYLAAVGFNALFSRLSCWATAVNVQFGCQQAMYFSKKFM